MMRSRVSRLVFYDVGKGGGVAAKAFDNGLHAFCLFPDEVLIGTKSSWYSSESSSNYYILQLWTGVCDL